MKTYKEVISVLSTEELEDIIKYNGWSFTDVSLQEVMSARKAAIEEILKERANVHEADKL
jgi:malic enzyme